MSMCEAAANQLFNVLTYVPHDVVVLSCTGRADNEPIVKAAKNHGMRNVVQTACLEGDTGLALNVAQLWMKLAYLKRRGYLHKGLADYVIIIWPHTSVCSTLIPNLLKFNLRFCVLGTESMLLKSYFKGRSSPLNSDKVTVVRTASDNYVWYLHNIPKDWLSDAPKPAAAFTD